MFESFQMCRRLLRMTLCIVNRSRTHLAKQSGLLARNVDALQGLVRREIVSIERETIKILALVVMVAGSTIKMVAFCYLVVAQIPDGEVSAGRVSLRLVHLLWASLLTALM